MTTEIAPTAEITALTTTEQQELQQLENVIARGVKTFEEVGNALAAIRDQRLYRDKHETFETYCRDRWEIGRSQAYRLIDAAAVVSNVSPIGDTVPANEAQARPLASLPAEEQRAAWQQAVETMPGGKPTAAHVQQVVDARKPKPSLPADYRQAQDRAAKVGLFLEMNAQGVFTLTREIDTSVACVSNNWTGLLGALGKLEQAKAAKPTPLNITPRPAAAGDEEIAASAAPRPAPPPLVMTPLTRAASSDGPAVLLAKRALLASALTLIEAQLATVEHAPAVVRQDQVDQAARLFVHSPALTGAAGLLALSIVFEAAA